MTAPKVMMLARRVCNAHHERMMPGETMSMGYVDPVRVIRADAPELVALVEALQFIALGPAYDETPQDAVLSMMKQAADAIAAYEALK